MTQALSPELYLLILFARQRLTERQTANAQAIVRAGVHWDALLRMSGRSGACGFLQRHLSGFHGPSAPLEVRKYLETQYRSRAVANLRIWSQLREIGEAFNRSGVQFALLKGAFLAYWVYDDPALRPIGDLDLLCREQDWSGVKDLMRNLGYVQKTQTPAEELLTLHPPGFVRGQLPAVEVHTSLRGLWQGHELLGRSTEIQRDGVNFLTLGFADLVRYQIAHIAQHRRHQRLPLFWFADIHEVADRESLLFRECRQSLAAYAERDPSTASVWSFLARYWLDAPGLEESHVCPAHKVFVQRISGYKISVATRYFRALRNVRYWSGARDKMRYLRRLVFPPVEYLMARGQVKPGIRVYLHYLTRFVAIPARAVKSLFRGQRSS
jgi:ribosomal protein S18 acetylase RimI-like enzyme